MIIVNLKGGLGNQMFQYALGKALSTKLNVPLKLDLSFLLDRPSNPNYTLRDYDLDIYKLTVQFATSEDKNKYICPYSRNPKIFLWRLRRKLLGYNCYVEKKFSYDERVLNLGKNTYLDGYWQTEKYFVEIKSLIRSDFEFKEEISERAKEMLNKIKNTNSICLNIRRTDFVTNPINNEFLGVCGVDYFQRADKIIKQKTSNPTYFVFSDDIEWCETNLKFDVPTIFVSHEFAGRKFQDYLRLMSSCQHFVIPNSSFAWWSVWFNQNEHKTVVAPKKWFSDLSIDTSDLIPNDWIMI